MPARLSAYFELLAELACLGCELGVDARGAQLGGESACVARQRAVHLRHDTWHVLSSVLMSPASFQLVEEPRRSDRDAHAGSFDFVYALARVVVRPPLQMLPTCGKSSRNVS